jgi:choline kinase
MIDMLGAYGVDSISVGLGHDALAVQHSVELHRQILKGRGGMQCEFFHAHNYKSCDNLYTLWCMRDKLFREPFILINGDLVFERALLNLVTHAKPPCIATSYNTALDYPGVTLTDGAVASVGPSVWSDAVAVGVYYFNPVMSEAFFNHVDQMLVGNMRIQGFHYPLRHISSYVKMPALDVTNLRFTDVDTPEDLVLAKQIVEEDK